ECGRNLPSAQNLKGRLPSPAATYNPGWLLSWVRLDAIGLAVLCVFRRLFRRRGAFFTRRRSALLAITDGDQFLFEPDLLLLRHGGRCAVRRHIVHGRVFVGGLRTSWSTCRQTQFTRQPVNDRPGRAPHERRGKA